MDEDEDLTLKANPQFSFCSLTGAEGATANGPTTAAFDG